MSTPANYTPAKVIYGLIGLGFIFPVLPPLAGLIYAYIAKGESDDLDSHLSFQIVTIWVAAILGLIVFVTAASVVGVIIAIPVGLFALVWTLARLISGLVLSLKDQPIRRTGALGLWAS